MTATPLPLESSRPLRLLIVEDLAHDADLMVRELQRAGYAPDWECVEDEPAFLAALARPLDIILSDYTLPQFSALRALTLLGERRLNASKETMRQRRDPGDRGSRARTGCRSG